VRKAGGVPFEFNTIGVDDGIAMGHVGMKYPCFEGDHRRQRGDRHPGPPLRRDGLHTNCDKIVPGMLMAAMRLDIRPSFAPGARWRPAQLEDGPGPRPHRRVLRGREALERQIGEEELKDIEDHGCPTAALAPACHGQLHELLDEALGWRSGKRDGAGRGEGPLQPGAVEHWRRSGAQILELVRRDITAKDIVTRRAIDNALILDMPWVDPPNTILHTLAIAHEAGILTTSRGSTSFRRRPPTFAGSPGPREVPHGRMWTTAGGVTAILWELLHGKSGLLHEKCLTVTGETLAETSRSTASAAPEGARPQRCTPTRPGSGRSAASAVSAIGATAEDFDPVDCIRTVPEAYSPTGGLAIFDGKPGPRGAW